MTLLLSGPLRWQDKAGRTLHLPVTLPTALLLVLARSGQWVPRAELASLFWPEAAAASAQLNLRVNLHKARRLLADLGIGVPVQGDRHRIRWVVPTARQDGDASPPASDFSLPHFEAFEAWLRDWRVGIAPIAPVPAPEGGAAGDADAFFGRRLELARLRASQRRVVVVVGDAGVGKSRLVATAFAGAPWLRCREGLQGGSFTQVAALLADHPEWLRDLGPYRLDVARLLPSVAPEEPLPPLDALTARVRLLEGLAHTIERHVGVLLVDDLQWSDATTLDWLLLLAHRGRTRWVATLREGGLSATAAQALHALVAGGHAEELALDGLDRDALNGLLHARRPDLGGPHGWPRVHRWLDALAAYTDGNAFFVTELARALTTDDDPQQLVRLPPPDRVSAMLRSRRDRLSPRTRAVVDAAALCLDRPDVGQLAAMANLTRSAVVDALDAAAAHGLMRGTVCRHDIIRAALREAIPPARAVEMHRRAAIWMAAHGAEPQFVAAHWRSAGHLAEAWPFVLMSAQRARQRGAHDVAVRALVEVRDAADDPALALRAEVMLAQEHLFDNLPAGREALASVLLRAEQLPSGPGRQTIEAHTLAALVDNAVFGGDLEHAAELAQALRARLQGLDADVLIEAHQVLIEAAMRQGDIDAARASLHALRAARAAPAVVLSFEGQIHWFAGDVREARRVFEQLLQRWPDYCRGLTIENDLAVMCHALGDLAAAESMARRSLLSWAGVPHTEALSRLVLGSTLTSQGRFDEALQVLRHAGQLGREQGSKLFVGEALSRESRLHTCAQDGPAARRALQEMLQVCGDVDEPLRGSAQALQQVLTALPGACTEAGAALVRLDRFAQRSRHPLVHARLWRARVAWADAAGDRAGALAAARRLSAQAGEAQLLEWRCEGLALTADLDTASAAAEARASALALAHSRGMGWLAARLAAPSAGAAAREVAQDGERP